MIMGEAWGQVWRLPGWNNGRMVNKYSKGALKNGKKSEVICADHLAYRIVIGFGSIVTLCLFFEQFLNASQRTQNTGGFHGQVNHFIVLAADHFFECFNIFNGDQIL